jgi:hypothetical protein
LGCGIGGVKGGGNINNNIYIYIYILYILYNPRACPGLYVPYVNLPPNVIIEKGASVKDELVLTGPDIDLVSRSAALIRGQISETRPNLAVFHSAKVAKFLLEPIN